MACKRSSDEPSECNSFLQSSKRMGQVATHILTAESEVEIDFNTSKKTQENSFKSTKQKEKKKFIFEEPSLPSLPLWEPPKLPDSDSNFLSVSASMDQVDDLPVTQIVFPSEMRSMRSILDTNHGNKENINIDYLPANSVEEFDSLEKKN
ncbi:uncharacterized protein LOC105847803 [Hydra vulgaris]|uniref:uncharacterized protein LOC105847803 n=1 Tax=Hydra vulgaris TaxID=6087 RepID=UPI001F5E5237|nr:uncharacterized protein LOC105847803 [Hydra vulgaris]